MEIPLNTAGHRTQTNEDWHFNIQHIAAQTRFVREHLFDQDIVVAYLEAGGLTQPNQLAEEGDDDDPKICYVAPIRLRRRPTRTVLASHSGAGVSSSAI